MHALGRKEYGRLGVGEGGEDCLVPTQVPGLAAARCLEVAAGTAVSYAVTEDGDCLAWGMGTNGQLGTGEEVNIAQYCHHFHRIPWKHFSVAGGCVRACENEGETTSREEGVGCE